MSWVKRCITVKLAAIFLIILLTNTGLCAGDFGETRTWEIPFLGVFKVPQEFNIAEVKNLKNLLASEMKKGEMVKKESLPKDTDFNLDKIDLALYQITMNDGQAYHESWLFALKINEHFPEVDKLFAKPIGIKQKIDSILANDSVNRYIDKLEFTDPQTGFGVKVIEITSFEFFVVDGKQVAAGGIRLLINYKDFVFPVYAKGYILNPDGNISIIALTTYDNDRLFWDPMMNTVLQDFTPYKK